MRKLNRLTMTLALLIMAATGAWAQSTLNVVEIEVPANWETDENPVTAGDLTGFYTSTVDEAKAWGATTDGFVVLFYAFNGNDASYIFFNDGKINNEVTTPFRKDLVFSNSKSGVKFYYTAEPTEWSLTPDETGKTWTLAKMPANNIELQVEYYAESNLFLSKDALADKTSIAVTAGDLGVEFGDDGKSANTITEGTPMTVTYNGTKKILGVNVVKKADNAYLKWDDGQKKLVATDIPTTATMVENNSNDYVEWAAGTYVVEGEVTINGMIGLNGNVELIIKDGAKLTAYQIWGGPSKYNLSIYGQANQTGQLVVNSSDDAITNVNTLEVHSAKVKSTSSTVDCGAFYDIKTFNVYGGSVDAENTGTLGYGILNGSMNIYGGEVKAVGKGTSSSQNSYGIKGYQSTLTVYGGKLWAESVASQGLDSNITLTKGDGFTGKIETSDNGTSWTEYTQDTTPGAPYVRVGY